MAVLQNVPAYVKQWSVYSINSFIMIGMAAIAICGQNLLAVMDLESDGSVQQEDVVTVCDRIAATIAEDTAYMPFDRAVLPELLKQLALDQSATACSDIQCLTLIGSMIGATTVIGGSIKKMKKETEIELKCVNVAEKTLINSVNLSSRSEWEILLDKEVPALTKNLMSRGAGGSATKRSREKNIFRNPLTYIGPVLLGGAAAGAWYYKRHYGNEGNSGPEEISLDDAPVRRRGE